jgi:magnesium-transporting ATPase (P-type)
MRVLGIAFRLLNAQIADGDGKPERGATWKKISPSLAWLGMIDPVRPEVKAAVLTCQTRAFAP